MRVQNWQKHKLLTALKLWHPNEKNPQLLKGSNIRGYQVFNTKLTNGRGTSLYIHKIVAENFVKRSKQEKNFVIHKDYDKQNNVAKNLKWVNRKGMEKHHSANPARDGSKQTQNSRSVNTNTSSKRRGRK